MTFYIVSEVVNYSSFKLPTQSSYYLVYICKILNLFSKKLMGIKKGLLIDAKLNN